MAQIITGGVVAGLVVLILVSATRGARKWHRRRQLSRELRMLREAAYRERPRPSVVL